MRNNDILLFVTNADPYMVKVADSLMALHLKMVHVACLAHAYHRVTEIIRRLSINVNGLVSNSKKVFLKASLRIEMFKIEASGISFPRFL